MKKIIAKNYYKICIFLAILYVCICFVPNLKIKTILFILGIILFIFIKINHSKIFNEINSKFFTQKYYIEKEKEEYLSSSEETALYNKVYNEYFKKK